MTCSCLCIFNKMHPHQDLHTLWPQVTKNLWESLASGWNQCGCLCLSSLPVNMSSKWDNQCWSHRVSFSHVCVIPLEERERWSQSMVTVSVVGFKIWLRSRETKMVNRALGRNRRNANPGKIFHTCLYEIHIKTVMIYEFISSVEYHAMSS